MEQVLVDYLNDLTPFSIGTGIAIVIAVISVGIGIYKGVKTLIDKYRAHVITNMKKEQEYNELKESIKKMTEQVSQLQTSIDLYNTETNDKLNTVTEKIEKIKNDSVNGDEVLKAQMDSYSTSIEELKNNINIINNKTNLLLESDKESNKAYITDKHIECMEKKYIDVYTLSTVEAVYEKYLAKNGNTFISNLMRDLRELPHTPPEEN